MLQRTNVDISAVVEFNKTQRQWNRRARLGYARAQKRLSKRGEDTSQSVEFWETVIRMNTQDNQRVWQQPKEETADGPGR